MQTNGKDMTVDKKTLGASLAGLAIKRPVTTVMIFLSMLLLGIFSSRLLPLEKFPGIDIPQIYINVPYPNSTPAEVERLITRPVEEALATISGIQQLRSYSKETGAEVSVEFNWDENIGAKSIEAREKIDAIRHTLPKDVERVLVYQFNTSDMPIFQLRISSDRDLSLAYDLLERHLKRPLERVQGVSRVELYGVNKREIAIRLDPIRVSALNIQVDALRSKLASYNFSMTAGHIYDDGGKILVNPVGEFKNIEEIENLIIAPSVRLKDIADIEYKLPRQLEGRHLNRTYAIGMNIFKESSANLVEVAGRVLTVVEETGKNPQFNGINLFLMDNVAEGVTESLSDLLSAGLLGALLSIIVLYLFLRHIPTTLIVVLSVPFSLCITLGVMYFMNYSLNILSMMGLMLAVGMLVDNAVVVSESIFLEREKGGDAIEATKRGVNKVSLAVIAGTATTAIVFLPNIIGKKVSLTIFLEHVAIAITISLFASLLIAQTLIPLLTSKINFKAKPKGQTQAAWQTRYGRMLLWSQQHKVWSSIIALLILVSVAVPMQAVTGDDEGGDNQDRLFMRYHLDSNYTIAEGEKIINKMEDYLYANKERFHFESVYSYYSPNDLQTTLLLPKEMPISLSELKELIRKDMPKFVRAKPEFGWQDGNGGGVRINLSGNSTEVLLSIADNIIPFLANIDGLTDVRTDITSQQKEVQIRIDRVAAHRFGMSTSEIADTISLALRGQNLRTFRYGDSGEIMVHLSYNEDIQSSMEALMKLPVTRMDERIITLSSVATLSVVPRLTEIRRYYRQTAIEIGANLDDLTLDEAKEKIELVMANIALPDGYQWSFDGSFRRQQESENIMQTNMLLAICMIYIVMAALFESLLLPTAVITSLLFSIVGVFWAFLLTGTSMSVMGMIGILILMGIVVNNGIVLVDHINQLINQGIAVQEAVVKGSVDRVRPILMTVATTILGLVPLALGSTQVGGDGPTYAPMAIAIIGGLAFSTMTSLFLVPLAYVLLLRMKTATSRLLQRSKLIVDKAIRI